MKKQLNIIRQFSIKNNILPRYFDPNHDINEFLRNYFSSSKDKTIIQIGANDGVMSDPLRPFFKIPGNYRAILVEPLPFYVNKLNLLYGDRDDINIIQAAVGCNEELKKFYYILPEMADLMNGDGPNNNWAHGQGSFDRSKVIYWIEQNRFRGEKYCSQIERFFESIECVEIPLVKTCNITPNAPNLLMVIVVQGFELDVLNGINWDHLPNYIMWEDDLDNGKTIDSFLTSMGYIYVCGKHDKIYSHK